MNHDSDVVFVVDDDPDVCQFVERMIQKMQLPVRTFSSAEQFLDSITEEPQGCLIVDMCMLGMSGLELLKELTARKWDLPTIVVSGYGDIRMTVDSFKSGAFTFLEKPYRSRELWEAIVQAIAAGKTRSEKRRRIKETQTAIKKLTGEELNVLRLLLTSIPLKAIAAELKLSMRTIVYRRTSILEKFNVKSNLDIDRLLNEAGIEIGDA